MRFEFNRGTVFKARVRTNMVVVTTLGLDDGSSRSAGTEPHMRQALPRVFVDHGEVLGALPIGAAVGYEVVGPYVVRGTRRKRACAGRCHATPWMPPGQLQPRQLPASRAGTPCAGSCRGLLISDTREFSCIHNGVLGRQAAHRRDRRGIAFWTYLAVGQTRACELTTFGG